MYLLLATCNKASDGIKYELSSCNKASDGVVIIVLYETNKEMLSPVLFHVKYYYFCRAMITTSAIYYEKQR